MTPPGGRFAQSMGERLLMSAMVIVAVVACAIMVTDHGSSGSSGDGDATKEVGSERDPDDPAATAVVAAVSTDEELRPTDDRPVIDAFERTELDGGKLGWATITGSWRIVADAPAGRLSASPTSDDAARGVFVPPDALGDSWELAAKVGLPAPNMGLLWAVEDASNYWEVRLLPDNAAIVVNQTVEGQIHQVALFGPLGLTPGDSLRIQRNGDSVLVAVDETVLGAWTHPDLADRRRAGVFAGPEGGGFDRVLVASLN